MIRVAQNLRDGASSAATVEQFSGQLCSLLHEAFVDDEGGRQAVLVRLYLTQPASVLPGLERNFAAPSGGDVRCLTLLGTAGVEPWWNERRRSQGHLSIALEDSERIGQMPMIAGLLDQMGVDLTALVHAAGLPPENYRNRYSVFHVPVALGSPLIPAQDFVRKHDVRSVAGFGGVLPDGELYAVVMFCRVAVPRDVAELLETLSPSITLALTGLLESPVFDDRPEDVGSRTSRGERVEAENVLLRGLLEVHERVAARESDRARTAVEGATRQAERSTRLARTLQASLLPLELPKVSGLRAAAHFRPAGDGSEVGGDFYDLFPVRRGVWGLVLGDVSGKGAEAAALTALARHTVRAAALRAKHSLAVLHDLNEAVYRQQIADERYLTAVFALLTRRGAALDVDLCLGGHDAPHVLRAGQPAVEVGSVGQPLGMFAHAELARTEFSLFRGETLIAYTDGVTEARRGSDLYGSERVDATLSALSDRTVEDIVNGLAQAVQGYQGPDSADDIAILAIQSTR